MRIASPHLFRTSVRIGIEVLTIVNRHVRYTQGG
jgi:hypothetical protein